MSFGSYQQFCEQRRHTLASGGTAREAALGFDIQLPTRYPAGAGAATATSHFFGANMQQPPQHTSQLPSSFFIGQDPSTQPLQGKDDFSVIFSLYEVIRIIILDVE